MKNWGFKLRLAARNLTGKNTLFSLAVYFLLFIMLTISLVTFAHKEMLKQIFYYQSKETYQRIDIVLTYDENSTVKIVNQRNLINYRSYFTFYEVFYNFYAVIEDEENIHYADVYASDIVGLSRVIDYPVDNIAPGEAHISASFAAESGLGEGDAFTLFLGGVEYDFTVKNVISDRGVLTGNAIFVLKDEILGEIIGPGTTNLGNTIYFRVKPGVKIEDAISALRDDPEYGQYNIRPTIDYEYIDYYARFGSSVFMAVGLLVFFALLLMIRSIFFLYFKDFNSQYAIINILGGSRGFAFQIWIFQLTLLSLLALPPAVGLCQWVFNIAARAYDVQSHITVPAWTIAAAVAAYGAILACELVIRYLQVKRESLVSMSKGAKNAVARTGYALAFLAALALANNLTAPFGPGIRAIVNIIILAAAAVLTVDLIIRFVCRMSGRMRKKTVFNLFTAKYLSENKIIKHSLRVMTIALVVIAAVLAAIESLQKDDSQFRERIHTDYMVANISDYRPNLVTEIKDSYPVEDIAPAVCFQNVYIKDYGKGVTFFLSLEYDNIDNYFTFAFDTESAAKLRSSDGLYVVFPEAFRQMYGGKIGDKVKMKLSATLGEVEFTVAGFYESEYGTFAFSNYRAHAGENAVNALLFNAGEDFSDEDKADLVRRYGSKMYVFVDVGKTVEAAFAILNRITAIIMWVFWFIAGGFAVVIINNLLLALSQLKADYARLRILGLDDRQLARGIITEAALIALIAFAVAFVVLLLLFPNFSPMILVFGYYKEIAVSGDVLLKYLALDALVFIPAYLCYGFRIKYINAIDTIRKF